MRHRTDMQDRWKYVVSVAPSNHLSPVSSDSARSALARAKRRQAILTELAEPGHIDLTPLRDEESKCLGLAARFNPRLAFVDFDMPRNGRVRVRQMCRDAGFDELVTKPMSFVTSPRPSASSRIDRNVCRHRTN